MIPARNTRVLIVEGDADSADTLADLLRLWGFCPRTVRNGQAALIAIRLDPPDVVLLDLGLPFISGWEVAKELSESRAPKRLFVIAISGYSQNPAGEAGVDMHLVKPVNPSELLLILEQLECDFSGRLPGGGANPCLPRSTALAS